MPLPIQLLSERPNVAPPDLFDLHDGPIIACDCYVIGAEHWQPVVGGYADGRIINVDHHAPTVAMARKVSSANLALERVRAPGRTSADTMLFVTHTDCDSVLSAGILSGTLAAEDRDGDAALAAAHTGDPNPIAELLQALDIPRFDPAYCGRWHAGSNRRAGGTHLSVQAYVRLLRERVEAVQRLPE